MNGAFPHVKTALVVGHPGHELRVYHWLEIMRPVVFVMTDGSGRYRQSRLSSTDRLLDQVSAGKGSFYGQLSDGDAYCAILNGDLDLFARLARELAAYLLTEQIEYVAGDALEGYNPTHDVCRLVINAAVEMANSGAGRKVGNFDFPLTGRPDKYDGEDAISLQLDNKAFARKITAARSYAELDSEVEEAIRQNYAEAFRVERLRPVDSNEIGFEFNEKPYYERYGEQQVAAGHYRDVIRYREHFMPLAEALWQQVAKGI